MSWTDAQGHEINDLKVYWNYSDRSTGKQLPFGVWRLRLSHYAPWGEVRLTPADGSCDVTMQLRFEAWGANMVAFLGVDSSWSYESNGRMEGEYLEAISAVLKQEGGEVKPPVEEPEFR
jgi:hypothetical protein